MLNIHVRCILPALLMFMAPCLTAASARTDKPFVTRSLSLISEPMLLLAVSALITLIGSGILIAGYSNRSKYRRKLSALHPISGTLTRNQVQ